MTLLSFRLQADHELGLEGSEDGKQYDAGRRLNAAFSAFGSKVKRPGMLYIINLLFRIYFRVRLLLNSHSLSSIFAGRTLPSRMLAQNPETEGRFRLDSDD